MKSPTITNKIYCENCLVTMSRMADASVDAIVTDPPYGLKFMGKRWDCQVPGADIWRECLRVLKPGGHLLAFAGTRTQHRMAVNIEDGGFEIRDMIAWVYGSGFPKSMDISKAVDKMKGAEREVIGESHFNNRRPNPPQSERYVQAGHKAYITAPASPEAEQWDGWGTALKPAFEPITVARKPLTGTVAANVLQYGTGGLNVDGCRVETSDSWTRIAGFTPTNEGYGNGMFANKNNGEMHGKGRFPANFIHDGSEEVTALFPDVSCLGVHNGSAARFFYTAKASQSERGKGNDHPTVKPLALMRYLVRLVTPPGGLVYDPFAGSGTTLIAAIEEGFEAIGSDLEAHHCKIFNRRTRHGLQPKMF